MAYEILIFISFVSENLVSIYSKTNLFFDLGPFLIKVLPWRWWQKSFLCRCLEQHCILAKTPFFRAEGGSQSS